MSITEQNQIDSIGIEKDSVILTISDHLEWSDIQEHLQMLQNKLNKYIEFIESGQIRTDYPQSIDQCVIIRIVCLNEYPMEGSDFINKVMPVLKSIRVSIEQQVL